MIHMGFSGAVAFLLVRVFKVMGFFSCWEYCAIVDVRCAFLLHVMVGSNGYEYQCAATVEHVLGSVKFFSFF
jgi:hypothetical protein